MHRALAAKLLDEISRKENGEERIGKREEADFALVSRRDVSRERPCRSNFPPGAVMRRRGGFYSCRGRGWSCERFQLQMRVARD
jgi:hypothetical protein